VLVGQIRISVILLTTQLLGLIKQQEVSKELLGELQEKALHAIKTLTLAFESSEYRCQLHVLTTVRRGLFESHHLLGLVREAVQKNKKLKGFKETVNGVADPLLDALLDSIINLRWSVRPSSDSKLVAARDEAVERQLSLDLNQAKRLVGKYQSSIKW
jgi:hypothetical protein